MKAWTDALRVLIAGSNRTPVPPQASLVQQVPADWAGLLVQLGQGAADESRLWQSLAALDLCRRAGFSPGSTESGAGAIPQTGTAAMPDTGGAAQADTLVACGERAEALLGQMLQGVQADLITQWLVLAAQRGRRIPHGLLPVVLDWGAGRGTGVQALVRAAADARGRWLAQHNPRWQYVGDASAETTEIAALQSLWETGDADQRAAALQRWRTLEPDTARAALQASWSAETPQARARFLELLGHGLCMADEPFLETALDDKRKEVRQVALDLLRRLPQSALVTRITGHLTALVRLKDRLLMGKKLAVDLPAEPDKPLLRDGIGRERRQRLGEKASVLADMVAAVPLVHWSTLLQASPAQALKQLMEHEHRHALLTGLSEACLRDPQAHQDWTLALLDLWLQQDKQLKGHFVDGFASAVQRLPIPVADAALLTWVQQSPAVWADDQPVANLLAGCVTPDRAWSVALSLAVVTRLAASGKVLGAPYSALRHAVQGCSGAVDCSAPARYENLWPAPKSDDTPVWQRMHQDFMATVRQRHALYSSFDGDSDGP